MANDAEALKFCRFLLNEYAEAYGYADGALRVIAAGCAPDDPAAYATSVVERLEAKMSPLTPRPRA